MTRLVLALAPESCNGVEAMLQEHTAGRWRRWVTIHLLKKDKAVDTAELHALAGESDTPIYAPATGIGDWLETAHSHVHRFRRNELLAAVSKWLDDNFLTWNSSESKLKGLSGFQLGNVRDWRGQFTRVDPMLGPRVAKALLAQLRIVRMGDLAEMLTATGSFAYNVYFAGNDPHSGDLAMVGPLASRLDDPSSLSEGMSLPKGMPDGAKIRLFSDGSWSGGETEKRVKCLTTACANKAGFVRPTQSLQVSIGFATKTAMSRLNERAKKLQKLGIALELASAHVLDAKAGAGHGLAFTEDDVNRYVDPLNPNAYFEFCLRLGEMVFPGRPLGTAEIASTIGFEHSLPKAMLPFFIFGNGGAVTAADGSTFGWMPLLRSMHVLAPASNVKGHHCESCALK